MIWPNNCELFKSLSVETWQRIAFSHKHRGFKIFETTITQNILFQILKTRTMGLSGPYLEAYEAINERANGNDIELYIESASGKFDFYAVQAKIIYKNGKYNALNDIYQCANLITYAKINHGTPIYLFYNHGPLNHRQLFSTQLGITLPSSDVSLYGCSYAHAYNALYLIRRPGRVSLTDVNYNYALPWHILVCGGTHFEDNINKKQYSRKDITEDRKWVSIELDKLSKSHQNSESQGISKNLFSLDDVSDEKEIATLKGKKIIGTSIVMNKEFTGKIVKRIEHKLENYDLDLDVGVFPFTETELENTIKFDPKLRVILSRSKGSK